MNSVLYFTSPTCSVCLHLKPKIKSLVESKFPKLEFQTIDISTKPEFAAQQGVFTAPTVLVFFDEKESLRFVRNMSVIDFEEKVERLYNLYFE